MYRVLVVDDDESVRNVLTATLIQNGYEALAVESGMQAMVRQHIFRPDVALLDIRMPEMDGLETLQWMRRYNPDVIVIMMTGVIEEHIGHEAIRRGASDYITKPFEWNQVEMTLNVHLLMHTPAR